MAPQTDRHFVDMRFISENIRITLRFFRHYNCYVISTFHSFSTYFLQFLRLGCQNAHLVESSHGFFFEADIYVSVSNRTINSFAHERMDFPTFHCLLYRYQCGVVKGTHDNDKSTYF